MRGIIVPQDIDKPWCIEVSNFENEVAFVLWFVFVMCFQYKYMKFKNYCNV
jgi:hypothetical protein